MSTTAARRWADWAPPDPRKKPATTPHFPVLGFAPGSPCPHLGPYPSYTRLVCMVCHRTGAGLERRASLNFAPVESDTPTDPAAIKARATRQKRKAKAAKGAT